MYLPVYVKQYKASNDKAVMWFNIFGKADIDNECANKPEKLYVETKIIDSYVCDGVAIKMTMLEYNDIKKVYDWLIEWLNTEVMSKDSVSIKLNDTIDLVFESGIYDNMVAFSIYYSGMKTEKSIGFISTYAVKEVITYDLNLYEVIKFTDMLKEVLNDLNYLDESRN